MTTDTADPIMAPLQNLLNRQIERSTPARREIQALEGRTMAIRLRNTVLTLYFSVVDGQLELSRHYDNDPDVILDTTPLGLAELARGSASGGSIDMSGDPVIAQHFQSLLQHTHPDWEEELSRLVGDVAAHQLGNLVRGVLAFGQRATESVSRSAAEFVQEERRDVPTSSEIQEFYEQVASVTEHVESLARRVENLMTRSR